MGGQVEKSIDAEASDLMERYDLGGMSGLVKAINSRDSRPDAPLYLLIDFSGNYITGNIQSLPDQITGTADSELEFIKYHHLVTSYTDAEDRKKSYHAAVRFYDLPGNFRLLVGRDLQEQSRFHDLLNQALRLWLGVMVVVAAITWFFVNQRVLKRIDGMTRTSETLMNGDLSDRLKVTGNGDEFDRLAVNLNTMLDRIEDLMKGLKEVSDNIAHDLKTPLTRMRGRVEAHLRQDKGPNVNRGALEEVLVETDEIIGIFNALLRISRVEAGSSGARQNPVNLTQITHDICELYEPVAEMEEVGFEADLEDGVQVTGDRELLSQAIANIIENALKYGRPEDDAVSQKIRVTLRVEGETVFVEVSDNGRGIGEEQREYVCDRFVRLDESRTEPGSGLGLSLVKAVMSLHSGGLQLESAMPGLKVVLSLPKLQEKAARTRLGRRDHVTSTQPGDRSET